MTNINTEFTPGNTFETKHLRVRCWTDTFTVTMLENAGKRGKMVDKLTLSFPIGRTYRGPACDLLANIAKETTAEAVWSLLGCGVEYAREKCGETAHRYRDEVKGMDVAPAGAQEYIFSGPKYSIKISYRDFSGADLIDRNNEPRALLRKVAQCTKLWKLAKAGKVSIPNDASFYQALNVLSDLGIKGIHTWCAMD